VGETLAPSVRRTLQPILALVLICAGLLANLPLLAVSLLLGRVHGDWLPSRNWVGLAIVASAIGDVVFIRGGRPKPWAIHTQVPQWWGHKFGPWWGSTRYGLRLGLGPATILNSWLWWGALVVTIGSPGTMAFGLSTFVFVRTLTTIAVGWGVGSGSAMAQRARQLDSAALRVRYGVSAAVVAAVVIWLAVSA
jgi:hypothetical protein